MKRITHSIVPLATLCAGFGLGLLAPEAKAQARGFQLPANAQEVEPGAYYLGRARDVDGRVVDGLAFVHPRRQAARGGGKPTGGSTCYSFLASGARWKAQEPFIVDTANSDGLDGLVVLDVINSGLGAWETAAGRPIFGNFDPDGIVDGEDSVQPDGKNEFLFGPVNDPGVIAVTIVWGVFGGPPQNRQLVEWDMVCDDPDFAWGDALLTPAAMDFANIFVHEAGHAAGLGHSGTSCTDETMYAYASEGETKKRDLNAGDIAGIRALYP